MYDLNALKQALRFAKTQPDQMALYVLKNAVELFIEAQDKESSDKAKENLLKMMHKNNADMIPQRCPKCGIPGAHYCTGKHPVSGIEYWMNQPRMITGF